MHRFLLLAVGSVLALLALPADAQAQGQAQAVGATQKPKVRVLAIARTPLAAEHLPEGGLVLALANASLAQAGPGDFANRPIDVRWKGTAPLTETLLSDPSIDIALPVEGADCEQPNDLTQSLAVLCDQTTFSEPLLQIVIGLFALSDSGFTFEKDENIFGKTICLTQDYDPSILNSGGRNWVSYKRVTVLRRPTLLDCVAAVQAREAHAFIAGDLEGRYLLGRLGLGQFYAMQARPLATRGLHAVVSRDHAKGAELIDALNRGLKQLKQSEAYSAIVQKHLLKMWDEPVSVPPVAVAAAPIPKQPQKSLAVEPAVREAPKAPPAAIGPADRERALRYMKRGDEELEDGRVAPARLLYERAAEMGLAQAAMALAATYDATELAKLNLRQVHPNVTEARRWYERALALGLADARERLQRLGAAN